MDQTKIIYRSFVAGTATIFIAGIWLAFFADPLLEKRAQIVQARVGQKCAAFFVSAIRALSLTAAVLAFYLLITLLRIVNCALK